MMDGALFRAARFETSRMLTSFRHAVSVFCVPLPTPMHGAGSPGPTEPTLPSCADIHLIRN